MGTSRITDPISDRLPSPGAVVATVTGVTSDLADHVTHHLPDHIGDHLSDIDLADAARRTHSTLARVVPWMSVEPSWRRRNSRWLLVAAVVGVAVAVALLKRRSSDVPDARPDRDDWSTASTNGSGPSTPVADREPATTIA